MIERFIDYMQFSAKLEEFKLIERGYKTCEAVKFYRAGYRDENGLRFFFGNPKSDKALVIASGDAMQSLRNGQNLDAEILQWVLQIGGKITRLDLAVTDWIEESLVKLDDIKSWLREGIVTSPLMENGSAKGIFSLHSDHDCLETLYVGNMKKRGRKGIFRAYDKGIEMGIGNEIVTRLELELRGEKAHNNARRISETNDISGNFRASFDVKSRDFDRLMDADAVKPARGKAKEKGLDDKEKNRWTWLIKQVAPSLKEAIARDMELGIGDANLTQFLIASGLTEEMIKAVHIAANNRYKDVLQSNGLVDFNSVK